MTKQHALTRDFNVKMPKNHGSLRLVGGSLMKTTTTLTNYESST